MAYIAPVVVVVSNLFVFLELYKKYEEIFSLVFFMIEQTTVNQRIAQIIDKFAYGNQSAFGRAVGIPSGTVAGLVGTKQIKPGFEILQKIGQAYSQVNWEWIMYGTGPMVKAERLPSQDTLITFKGYGVIEPSGIPAYLNALFGLYEEISQEIASIEARKGNWIIRFHNKPSYQLLFAILTLFDTRLSYDGIEEITTYYKTSQEKSYYNVAGCLRDSSKAKAMLIDLL